VAPITNITYVAAGRILSGMTWPTSVNHHQQQQQLAMMTSTLDGDGDGLLGTNCSAPDRRDVDEARPALSATAPNSVDSAAEAGDGDCTATTRHNRLSRSDDIDDDDDDDDDAEKKLVIDCS